MSNQQKRNEALVATRNLTNPLILWVDKVKEAFGEIEGTKAFSILLLLDAVRWQLISADREAQEKENL